MMDAWVAFAKTGNPAHPGIGDWEPYDPLSRKTMIFGKETGQAVAPFEAERAVWFDIIGE
jgi:para-nitrobenzyl esterase